MLKVTPNAALVFASLSLQKNKNKTKKNDHRPPTQRSTSSSQAPLLCCTRRGSRRRRIVGVGAAMVGALRRLQLDALLIPAIVLALAMVPGIVPIALVILVAARRGGTGPRILGILRRRRVVRRRGRRHPAGSVQWLATDLSTAARVAAVHRCVSRSAPQQVR